MGTRLLVGFIEYVKKKSQNLIVSYILQVRWPDCVGNLLSTGKILTKDFKKDFEPRISSRQMLHGHNVIFFSLPGRLFKLNFRILNYDSVTVGISVVITGRSRPWAKRVGGGGVILLAPPAFLHSVITFFTQNKGRGRVPHNPSLRSATDNCRNPSWEMAQKTANELKLNCFLIIHRFSIAMLIQE